MLENLQPGHYKDGLQNKGPLNLSNLSVGENQIGSPEKDEQNRSTGQCIKTQSATG